MKKSINSLAFFGLSISTLISPPVFSKEISIYNTIPILSIDKSWERTPLRYFSQKADIYPEEFFTEYLGEPLPSKAETNDKIHNLDFPIVPFNPIGVNMNFDIVLGISDDSYSMLELIRVDLEQDQSIWFILDSKFNGQQFIGLPVDAIHRDIVADIAENLGISTYHSGLHIPQIQEGEDRSIYTFSYTRKDPEGIAKNKAIALEITIPHTLNVDREESTGTVVAKQRARNSSAMNHSEMTLLPTIDIYKATPFSQTKKILVKDLNTTDGQAPLQKILNVEIKSILSQTILGLGAGSNTLSTDHSLELVSETNQQVIYSHSNKSGELSLQYIEYLFQKSDGKRQLQSILIKQSENTKPIGSMHFNPPLPDLRYTLKPELHKSRVIFNIREPNDQESHAFFLGEVHTQNDSSIGAHIIEIIPGNADLKHRKIYKGTPDWFYNRALFTSVSKQINGDVRINMHIMAAQHSNLSEGSYQSEEMDTAKLLQAFDIKWDVRSHRLSKLVVKNDHSAIDELRQHKPEHSNLGYGLAYLEGGTWGSGEAAKDLAMGSICQKNLSGAKFLNISSNSFPLRLSVQDFPYNKSFYRREKAKVIGVHKMNIHLDEEIDLSKTSIALNGFKLTAGPNHKPIGVTTNGLEFAIITEDSVLANGEKIYAPRINEQNPYLLEIYVKASHNFGPELTRPSSGPTRQSLSSYSAIANIDLLIIKHANTIDSTYSKNLFAKTKPFHIGKADPLKMVTSNRTICLNSEGRADLTTDSIRFLTQIKFTATKPKEQPLEDQYAIESARRSRYIRQLSMILGTPNQDNYDMTVDNKGEVTWKTRFIHELGIGDSRPRD